MRRWHHALIVLIMLSAAMLAVGTGADTVTYDDVDALELTPVGEDNNNAYVSETDDGEIRIHVTGDGSPGGGVNDNAVTDLGAVFTIENVFPSGDSSDTQAGSHATVWVDNNGGEEVTFYDASTNEPIETDLEGTELSPGESVSVGIRIDTTGETTLAITTLTVLAQIDESHGSSDDETRSSYNSSSSVDADDEEIDQEPPEPPEEDTSDSETDDDGVGLIELAGLGAPASLAVIAVVAGMLAVAYIYRTRVEAAEPPENTGEL